METTIRERTGKFKLYYYFIRPEGTKMKCTEGELMEYKELIKASDKQVRKFFRQMIKDFNDNLRGSLPREFIKVEHQVIAKKGKSKKQTLRYIKV